MKTHFITGASGYLGQHLTQALAQQPCHLVLSDAHANKLAQWGKTLVAHSHADCQITEVPFDFQQLNPQGLQQLGDMAKAHFPVIDSLIHLAGYHPGYTPLANQTGQAMQQSQWINATFPILLTQQLLPCLQRASSPKVLAFGEWHQRSVHLPHQNSTAHTTNPTAPAIGYGGYYHLSQQQLQLAFDLWQAELPHIQFLYQLIQVDTPNRRRQFPGLAPNQMTDVHTWVEMVQQQLSDKFEEALHGVSKTFNPDIS